MLPWPKKIPQPNLPTIPETDLIPSTYFSIIQNGIFPKNWWLPTSEPTSDGLTGVGLHDWQHPVRQSPQTTCHQTFCLLPTLLTNTSALICIMRFAEYVTLTPKSING